MENESQKESIDRGLRLLVKSSFIVFITLFLSKVFLYLYRIIIAKHYGPGVYGLFALSIMFVGWFRIFSGLGLKEGLLRYISLFRGKKENKKIQYVFRKSFLLTIFTSILAGFLLFLFSESIALKFFSNTDLILFLKIFSVTLPFLVIGGIFLAVIRAYEKIGWFSFISNVLWNLATLITLIILIGLGINSTSVAISYLVGTFAMFAMAYVVCKIKLPEIFKSSRKIQEKDKKIFDKMFSYSWPFIFYGAMISIFYWIDSFMIGIFKTVDDVGFYHAAIPIASLLVLPIDLFKQLFFPLVTKEYAKGNIEGVKQLSQQVGKWVFMMAAPFFILLMIFPGVFINTLFGPEYLVAENALRFLSIGALFTTLFGISEELISMKGKSKIILADIACVAIANVILNILFVPKYGITGAGLATMLSVISLNLLFFTQSYKYLSIIPFRRKMLKIALIVIFSSILLLFIKSFVQTNLSSLIVCGTFFISVYTLLVLTTNCLDKNDWQILKLIYSKIKG
ncbi:MAG: flippase [archaeon]